jgi:hypothetical protein
MVFKEFGCLEAIRLLKQEGASIEFIGFAPDRQRERQFGRSFLVGLTKPRWLTFTRSHILVALSLGVSFR